VSHAETARLALEQRSPLTALRHYHMGWPHSLPEQGAGFLSASPAGVVVLTVRPLANHDAYLVRVHNSSPQSVQATLQFPVVRLEDAYLGSVLGERVGSVQWTPQTVELPMSRYDIQSLVVRMKTVKD